MRAPVHRAALFAALFVASLGTSCSDAGSSADDAPSNGSENGRSLMDAPAGDVSAPAPELDIPTDAPTVLFVGDSLGAGLHLAEHQAFPAVLQRRLVADDAPFHLVNASESGRTTSQGAAVVRWNTSRGERPIDLVVIELGGNDGLRGIDLDTVESNLRETIAAAREADARVLLLGVRMSPDLGAYAEAFDAIYPRLAQELDVAFVPHFLDGVGGVPELNVPDGLHPTAEGHERLADTIEPVLRETVANLVTGAAR